MIDINPIKIKGDWDDGYALDLHTLSSEFVGYDEYDHPRFDTKHSQIGELIYKLKYGNDYSVIDEIVDAAVIFIKDKWGNRIDYIIPIPPSKTDRQKQPVELLASKIAGRLNIEFNKDILIKIKDTGELKSIDDPDERTRILTNAFDIAQNAVENKNILLIDDLYRSGATIKTISNLLRKHGKVNKIYVLAFTRTRVKS